MNKVFITGGTGFIGSHVVTYFCEQGVEVGCLVREGSDLSVLGKLPVRLHYGEITDFATLDQILYGYDTLIHIAAYARDWGKYDEFYQVNVEGTLNILRAAKEQGVRQIILTSTNSVYGEEHSYQVKDESSPHNPHYPYWGDSWFPSQLNFYRDTKKIAKEKGIDYAISTGLNLTILEPVWVYGEREFNTGFYEYLKTVKGGIPFLPGSKKNKFHVVYAGDLARAYYLAYQKRLTGINSFIIGNEQAEMMERIYTIFCEVAGYKKPANLPKGLIYPLAFTLELICTLCQSKKPPLLTRGRVNMFYDNIEYSTRKAKEILGFTPEYILEEGIRRTVTWYREQNLL